MDTPVDSETMPAPEPIEPEPIEPEPIAPDETPTDETPTDETPPERIDPIGRLHRTVSLLAVVSLFIGTLTSYDILIWSHPAAGITIMSGYGCALVLAILAVTVRGRRLMLGVDIGILGAALLVRLPGFFDSFHRSGRPYGNDEGALIDFAGKLLRAGIDPYTVRWPAASTPNQPGITLTMAGGIVDRFDYPPIPAIWAAAVRMVAPGVPRAAVAATASLFVATILLFVLLPAPWRSAATLLGIGLGIYLMPFARQGYPEIMALPFLIVAVNRWNRIGARGRLGAFGVTSAVCVGIAICTQQMAWFVAPFLVVGLLLLRLGDQPARIAWRLVARYLGITVGVAAVINAPFAFWHLKAWYTAILTPVTLETVPHGQGLIAVAYYLRGGSGALQFFSYASAALAVGLLVCFVLFIRRLGPAMSILPWPVFFLSIRSSDKYFYIMMPMWLICLATVHHRDFATAHAVNVRLAGFRPLRRPWTAALVTAVVLAPAAVCATLAIVTPQPLRMRIRGVTTSSTSLATEIRVDVTNTSSRSITPNFALSNSQALSRFWVRASGPETLAPGQAAAYTLRPSTPGSRRPLHGPRLLLRAVSVTPETLSSVQITNQ